MKKNLIIAVLLSVIVIGVVAFVARPPMPDRQMPQGENSANSTPVPTRTAVPTDSTPERQSEAVAELPDSQYYESYTLNDSIFGTETTVAISGNRRVIQTNAIPNHNTGQFPNPNNPNAISEQSSSYSIPLDPVFTGGQEFAREPGVAINGVKFEPQTAERVTCSSGETYSVEAIQDILDLGLDFNNAHVQPSGAYHYHGVSPDLVDFSDSGDDLVHVGFALDGHLMFYSKSGQFESGYELSNIERSGTNCTISGPGNKSIQIDGTVPDGSFVSDWVYSSSIGDLDECNGVEIGGEYVYMLTDEFPYIPRCLNGEFSEGRPPR